MNAWADTVGAVYWVHGSALGCDADALLLRGRQEGIEQEVLDQQQHTQQRQGNRPGPHDDPFQNASHLSRRRLVDGGDGLAAEDFPGDVRAQFLASDSAIGGAFDCGAELCGDLSRALYELTDELRSFFDRLG